MYTYIYTYTYTYIHICIHIHLCIYKPPPLISGPGAHLLERSFWGLPPAHLLGHGPLIWTIIVTKKKVFLRAKSVKIGQNFLRRLRRWGFWPQKLLFWPSGGGGPLIWNDLFGASPRPTYLGTAHIKGTAHLLGGGVSERKGVDILALQTRGVHSIPGLD